MVERKSNTQRAGCWIYAATCALYLVQALVRAWRFSHRDDPIADKYSAGPDLLAASLHSRSELPFPLFNTFLAFSTLWPLFNDRSIVSSLARSLQTMIAATYLIASSLFFLACAWAQLNDPDPEIWVTLYVIAGAIFNYTLLATSSTTVVRGVLSAATMAALGCTLYSAILLQQVRPDMDLSLPAKDIAWSFLEHEQGREIAGLMLLVGHLFQLGSCARSLNPSSTQHQVSAASWLSLAAMVAGLAWAVYAWIEYQPLMNMKYSTPHCNGAFDSPVDG